MNRKNWLFLGLFAAILGLAAYCGQSRAATPLPTAPPTGWCGDGPNATGYFNVAACQNTPPPGGWVPPPGQLLRANVAYNTDTRVDRNADLTQWQKTWGRVVYNEAGWPWPASSGSRPHWSLGRAQYTCTQFTVTNLTGLSQLSMASYQTVGNVDVAISPRCGDFSAWVGVARSGYAIGGPACSASGIGAFASRFMTYKSGPSTMSFCGLDQNATYYLNVRFKDATPIPSTGTLCNTLGCQVGIQSNPASR